MLGTDKKAANKDSGDRIFSIKYAGSVKIGGKNEQKSAKIYKNAPVLSRNLQK